MRSINILLLTVVISIGTIFAWDSASAQSGSLLLKRNGAIIDQFYKIHGAALFWYDPAAKEITNLRKSILSIIDSAKYLGINKNYNFPEESNMLSGVAAIESDKKFTAALVDFSRNILEGEGIDKLISNDEVSKNYTVFADSIILSWLCGMTANLDIKTYLSLLEPQDSVYRLLKDELKLQLNNGNELKVNEVTKCINIYRWITHFHLERCIVVNIPTAYLKAYGNGRLILSMRIVAGKPSTRTPRFATWCDKVVLYPYWNVPRSIATKELLPLFKKSPTRVERMNMQIIGHNGKKVDPNSLNWASFNRGNFPYTIRQCTGCDNALGVIKFNLTDPFSVYMHDTNFKIAFGSASRYYSHGCIRVQRPIELGNYLLNNKLDSNFLKACIKGQEPVVMYVAMPVPVFVVYLTADVVNGAVEYYGDIYHLN